VGTVLKIFVNALDPFYTLYFFATGNQHICCYAVDYYYYYLFGFSLSIAVLKLCFNVFFEGKLF
jgi:hypothetical protein